MNTREIICNLGGATLKFPQNYNKLHIGEPCNGCTVKWTNPTSPKPPTQLIAELKEKKGNLLVACGEERVWGGF